MGNTKNVKILIVHIDGNKEDITIDNIVTKIIIVIGNVINIHLTVDDKETLVFHRTFNFDNESGLAIGDKFEDLKPTYTLIKTDNVFPDVFEREQVKNAGIVFVTERNRASLLSGQGYTYIIDPKQSLNTFKDAGIVAFRNNLTYEPEVTRNISIIHGRPVKFKQIIETEKVNPNCNIMMDMSIDELKSFIEHRYIRSFETGIHSAPTHGQGFSLIDDLGKSISPARSLLTKIISDPTLLNELAYKIDNPFTFAFVKRRNPDTYQLLSYNIINNLGQLCEDNGLVPEKLKIILASKRERELDLSRENRCKELLASVHPGEMFLREYPRIDPFSTKRNAIRNSFAPPSITTVNQEDMVDKTVIDFIQQKRQMKIDKPGTYLIENANFVSVSIEAINVDIYVRECGLLFVKAKDSNIQSRLHIIGNIHSLMCYEKCEVICYFSIMNNTNNDYLFCTENETDCVGRFFDGSVTQFVSEFHNEQSGSKAVSLVPINPTLLPKPTTTRVKNLCHQETRNITNKSLVHIDNITQL